MASAITAILALAMSLGAVVISYFALRHQRKHDILSVRPIPAVTVGDYEGSVRVHIYNYGAGPMIVTKVCALKGSLSKSAVIDWMPDLPEGIYWKDFVGPVESRSLLPGQKLVLVRLDGDEAVPIYKEARDATRKALGPLTVRVEYSDIYGSKFEPYSKSLEWFARDK